MLPPCINLQKQGNEKYLAAATAKEIVKINQFENNWKLKTNINKFQIIPVGRKDSQKVKVGNITHEFSPQVKYLAPSFPSQVLFPMSQVESI